MKATHAIVFLSGLVLGALTVATLGQAHADTPPAFDRQMGEHIVRALEAQADAQKQQVQELRAIKDAVREAGRR